MNKKERIALIKELESELAYGRFIHTLDVAATAQVRTSQSLRKTACPCCTRRQALCWRKADMACVTRIRSMRSDFIRREDRV